MAMNQTLRNNLAAVAVTAVCIFAVVMGAGAVIDEKDDQTRGMPACATEDSDNCYWDADQMGNGEGKSFTIIDGVIWYWD